MFHFEQTKRTQMRTIKMRQGESNWLPHTDLASIHRFPFSSPMILLPFGRLFAAFLGYESMVIVGEAADGEVAIELAFRLTPHVVIIDVKMPRISGIEATRRINGFFQAWTSLEFPLGGTSLHLYSLVPEERFGEVKTFP
jgi:CheY-like chemotaxis protein